MDHAERCWAGYDGYVWTVRRMIMLMLMIMLSVVIMFFAVIMKMIMIVARGDGPVGNPPPARRPAARSALWPAHFMITVRHPGQ